ncbi:MAG TPA: ATP-binding cassette domain-containing protein [Minicystis sp.]|nr:ATP-binding cassette domain-containing protein [Minicystis sp.]
MIELERVEKRYGDEVALYPTDLRVEARTALALIGTSGSGKSTIVRMVAGLVVPDAGRVRVLGETMTPKTARALRRRMGYVIQEGGLFPHLTARDNAALLARHVGWDEARVRRRVGELAELAQLDVELLDRFPRELSGGQRQRVGLVRALMLDPELLLLDEPLGALDPVVRAQLQQDLVRVVRSLDKTVLLVTHDLAEAAVLADEVVLLRKGRVVQRGRLKELVDAPAEPFVTTFVTAQRNAWWAS